MNTAAAFKPKIIVKQLLTALQPRVRDVLTSRYGLGEKTERQTLESIGERYGITRERVRQIENHALNAIRKSGAYAKTRPAFDELERLVHAHGGIVHEADFLQSVAKDESTRNHVYFMLALGDIFVREREDESFTHRWHADPELAERVHKALKNLCGCLGREDVLSEPEIVASFLKELRDVSQKYKSNENVRRWLTLSKEIGRNPLGEWGRADSPNVRLKGIRDYAYIVIKRHGSPMHFTEVANTITKLFDKKAHTATTHNELIKDPRFVLVGRGLYALKEWGYTAGVVKDVIRGILKEQGPLSREDIIERVRKERYVKDNTILVNLQDSRLFRRAADGRYTAAA